MAASLRGVCAALGRTDKFLYAETFLGFLDPKYRPRLLIRAQFQY